MHLTRFSLLAFLLLVALALEPLTAQVRPVYNRGAAGLALRLARLQTLASALHTGAHPDDEDSNLIAALARGHAARVAYLALNRGEGGQNIIGTELFEALGVIRTEELLQARALDGGDQFFTRTMDYGFSKTQAEAARKWGEREVLGDIVRVIRTYRPLVVVGRFTGTPADGHGQHQLAGYLTPVAFRAAADPQQFPEQIAEGLRPWQAKKLYIGTGFRPDPANPPTTRIPTGTFDPVIGRSYTEIAMEGRSQHKSQEMGVIELRGPQQSPYRLLENLTTAPGKDEHDLFEGIPTGVLSIAELVGLPAGTLEGELAAISQAAVEATRSYDARQPERAIPALARGLTATRAARKALRGASAPELARADADFLLDAKETEFGEALVEASGLVIDPLSDTETVTPGGTVYVTVRAFASEPRAATVGAAQVEAPAGWQAAAGEPPAADDRDNPFARFFRESPTKAESFRVSAPADAPFTTPYWLRQPRQGDLFQWPADAPKGRPVAPSLLRARVPVTIGGVQVEVVRPVEYRFADRIRGEIRRAVQVVPAVDVGLDSRLLVVPTSARNQERRVVVRLGSFAPAAVSGSARLKVPAGWTVTPGSQSFSLKARGDETAVTFSVRTPSMMTAGTFEIAAEADVAGKVYAEDVQTIAYPHIQTHRLYARAAARVQVFDVTVAPVRVGYVMGSGDQVPDALRRLGVTVDLIDDEMLSTGDLSGFDTIMIGVRASEGRPAFVANHGRLLQYVERGGTLIVQYQQGDYASRGLPPFPGEIGTRVTDETASVKILQPAHPRFTFPNRITDADFAAWVQERHLYAFSRFDAKYTPLLEVSDPGEPPNQGGEVVAEIGKGRYVYTAYSWFRQLPAGVPGAYRMMANLISLSKAPR